MNKLFDLDSPHMIFLSKAADLVILSFWWFVSCIPIVTIGPASSALYYIALKIVRKEEIRVTACFFKGFRENFKQGIVYSFLFVILGAVLFFDYTFTAGIEGMVGTVCGVSFFVLGVWTLCTMFYTYPLQAQFYNTTKQTLINAMILSARKFPTTVIMFVINMAPILVAFASFQVFVQLTPVWVLLMPGLSAYLCSMLLVRIFDPLIAAAKKEAGQETDKIEE